jgi:dihydrofolate synthase/folylpolyglutamate synthase
MNYRQCVNYLYNLQKFGIKLGLANTEKLLNCLGNPHFKYPSVHIAGTNGKGSVCAMLESILCQQGLKTGLYTSPHLVSFTERIRICRREIEPEFITGFVNHLKNRIDRDKYTFFEVTTALAFIYFAEIKVGFAVIETGLGGRLDSTNVIRPEVAAITSIALEHTDILGKSLNKIAYEKGGIAKAGVATVVGMSNPGITKYLETLCKKRDSEFVAVENNSGWQIKEMSMDGSLFTATVGGKKYGNLRTNLAGRHQVKNAVFALNVVELLRKKGWNISDRAAKSGLKQVFWPCRFEVWRENPLVILDAAHNPSGIQTLVETFKDLLPDKKINFVFGVMADKNYKEMLRLLSSITKSMILVQPQGERSASLAELSAIADELKVNHTTFKSVRRGYRRALRLSTKNDVICVTGSHYTLGELLS